MQVRNILSTTQKIEAIDYVDLLMTFIYEMIYVSHVLILDPKGQLINFRTGRVNGVMIPSEGFRNACNLIGLKLTIVDNEVSIGEELGFRIGKRFYLADKTCLKCYDSLPCLTIVYHVDYEASDQLIDQIHTVLSPAYFPRQGKSYCNQAVYDWLTFSSGSTWIQRVTNAKGISFPYEFGSQKFSPCAVMKFADNMNDVDNGVLNETILEFAHNRCKDLEPISLQSFAKASFNKAEDTQFVGMTKDFSHICLPLTDNFGWFIQSGSAPGCFPLSHHALGANTLLREVSKHQWSREDLILLFKSVKINMGVINHLIPLNQIKEAICPFSETEVALTQILEWIVAILENSVLIPQEINMLNILTQLSVLLNEVINLRTTLGMFPRTSRLFSMMRFTLDRLTELELSNHSDDRA